MSPRFLNLEEVLAIHRTMIERYGGADGVGDMGLLESAVAMPQAGLREEFFHADLFEMGAAYLFHLVKNHPFIDGNKRVAVAAAVVFLEINGIDVRASNDALVDLVLAVIKGDRNKIDIAQFFRRHSHR